jgi:hypothetical protein
MGAPSPEELRVEAQEFLNILASMSQLKALVLWNMDHVDRSWAIPFASGGLSNLSLDRCMHLDIAGLDAILAAHTDTLRHLKLGHVPSCHLIVEGGPPYKLNKLESLSISHTDATKAYFRRFSSCPIKFLEIISLAPKVTPIKPG